MPHRVVVDSDGGIDDVAAVRFLLATPNVHVLAVTTVNGNVAVGQATTNLLATLDAAGRNNIPVASGAAAPLQRPRVPRDRSRHGVGGLGGERLPPPARGAVPQPPGELLATVTVTGGPVELLAIGPLTNVARLVKSAPSALSRIVVMGGRFDAALAPPEFNIATDPEAAEIVFSQSDVPILVVPYDVTVTVTGSLHDAVAAVALCQPELFATVDSAVAVDVTEQPGLTRLVQPGLPGRPAVSVVRDCDRDAVLAALPPPVDGGSGDWDCEFRFR